MDSHDDGSGTMNANSGILHPIFSDKSGAEEKRALRELVESWCGDAGGCAAALYEPGKGQRLAAVGDEEFPDAISDFEGEQGFTRLELPGGGALLHTATELVGGPMPSETGLLGAASAVCGMKKMLREQNIQAMSQGVELVALYEVGLAIASILDIEELAGEVLSRALMLTECSLGALYTLEDDEYRLACVKGVAAEAIAVTDLDLAVIRMSGGKPGVTILKGSETELAVSVEAEGQPRGLLAVGHPAGEGGELTAKDRSTLSLFANQAAIALEQARLHRAEVEKQRLDRELELAAEIQREILPDEMPTIPGYEVLGWNRPARHVGGDYYGFHRIEGDQWAPVLGDVTGKGAPAALLVSTFDSALRVLLRQLGVGTELADKLNHHIWDSSAANMFITLVVADLDPEAGELHYFNAGHNDGLAIHANGEVEHLKSVGPPLGLLEEFEYRMQSLELSPGDLVCLYSDGITECINLEEEEYEIDRLIEVLQEHREETLDEILSAIDRAVTDFGAGQPQGDDQTVILIRRVD
jgi:sigma-B regulation protein RsbU (phosphoserine phosphatase)